MELMARVEVRFLHFVLLAILMAMMHMFTIFELWRRDKTGSYSQDQQRAAIWSFAGIFCTLAAGLLADAETSTRSVVDTSLLAVPLFFMTRWGFHHWKISKDLLNLALIEAELNDVYRDAIGKALDRVPPGATIKLSEIIKDSQQTIRQSGGLPDGAGVFKRHVTVSVAEALDRFLPTSARLQPIVEEEAKKRNLGLAGDASGTGLAEAATSP